MKRLSRIWTLMGILAVATLGSPAALLDFGNPQGASAAPPALSESRPSGVSFTEDGQLLQPQGYHKWVYVGSPLTPNDLNGGKAAFPEFHSVYINPAALAEYEKTGVFPDGTMLVKELVSVGGKSATSGKGYFMGEFIGLEVAVKDATRFKDEPGNWAYFSFGHEYPLKDRTAPQPVANCNTCHGASAAQDYVFTQYYPVLRAAKDSKSAK